MQSSPAATHAFFPLPNVSMRGLWAEKPHNSSSLLLSVLATHLAALCSPHRLLPVFAIPAFEERESLLGGFQVFPSQHPEIRDLTHLTASVLTRTITQPNTDTKDRNSNTLTLNSYNLPKHQLTLINLSQLIPLILPTLKPQTPSLSLNCDPTRDLTLSMFF